jgi:hypothetical protein
MRWALLLPIALLGCRASSANPVPMAGERANLDRLAGSWSGSYDNPDAGRGGSIVFTLTAGESRATGDVVMVPRGMTQALRPAAVAMASGQDARAEVLTIDFVRMSGDSVSGTMAAYHDPECSCSATAMFRGRLDGNTIRGTFTSTQTQGRTSRGTWEVRRR